MEQLRMNMALDASIDTGIDNGNDNLSTHANNAIYVNIIPEIPDGYYMRSYAPGDEEDWCRCCYDGEMGVREISAGEFTRFMGGDKRVDLSNIYFLVSETDGIVGTVTYQYGHTACEAYIHMVGIDGAHRGRGLSRCMLQYALHKIASDGNAFVRLSTDDWRLPAIKTYLNCGFLPDAPDEDAKMRWRSVYGMLGIK